jgi:hypothetical protein
VTKFFFIVTSIVTLAVWPADAQLPLPPVSGPVVVYPSPPSNRGGNFWYSENWGLQDRRLRSGDWRIERERSDWRGHTWRDREVNEAWRQRGWRQGGWRRNREDRAKASSGEAVQGHYSGDRDDGRRPLFSDPRR